MQERQCFRSGDLLVSVAERRVLIRGTDIPIQPRCFDLLVYLLIHRDRAVGCDELVSAVWGKVALARSSLPQCMLRLRRTLSAAPALARAIRTVSRFGYQWTAPVDVETQLST